MALRRSQRVGLGVVGGVVALGVIVSAVLWFGEDATTGSPAPSGPAVPASPSPSATPTPSPTPTPTPTPTPEPEPTDPLNGGEVDDSGVFAVKLDNVAAARPQLGLGAADIVVAEEVEAGLSRLVGIYHSEYPDRVGPVRSARNTDVELLPLFGSPGLVYSGANSKVQANVQGSEHLNPIERSDRDTSRPAPHNVVVDLGALAEDHEMGEARDIGWRFGELDGPWEDAEEADHDFTVEIGQDEFTFTTRDDQYQPAVNGDEYRDADSGDRVLADTVVVLSVENRKDTDSTSSQSIVSETVGSGEVSITRQGRTLEGTWEREDETSPMTFTDDDGETILLNPGQTWLMLRG